MQKIALLLSTALLGAACGSEEEDYINSTADVSGETYVVDFWGTWYFENDSIDQPVDSACMRLSWNRGKGCITMPAATILQFVTRKDVEEVEGEDYDFTLEETGYSATATYYDVVGDNYRHTFNYYAQPTSSAEWVLRNKTCVVGKTSDGQDYCTLMMTLETLIIDGDTVGTSRLPARLKFISH